MSAPGSLLARVVFGLLVLATFTAFFVAQRLKQTEPLVYAVQMGKFVSPNGDDRRERVRLRFRTKRADVVSVQVIGRDGRTVRTLADERPAPAGSHRYRWNGRTAAGRPLPDGPYRVRITLHQRGRSFIPDKTFRVDTAAPRMRVAAVVPREVPVAGRRGPVRVRYTGVPAQSRAEFFVYRVRGGRASARPVAAFAGSRSVRRAYWNLKVGRFVERRKPCFGPLVSRGKARAAPAGQYVIAVQACDSAGNIGTGPADLPPHPGIADGRGGVAVRGLEAAPGMYAVRPGELLSLPIVSPWRDVSYRLRSLDGEVEKSGHATRSRVRLRVPLVKPGLYVLALRAPAGGRDGTARVPVVVRDDRRSPLVVVQPAIAWQGENAVDANGDGFPDTLSDEPSGSPLRLRTDRPLAGGRLPGGFATHEAAVTRFIGAVQGSPQSSAKSWDATTDFALAVAPQTWLRGRRAVVLVGDARWQSPAAGPALRRFVERGGSVVMFGQDSLRRTVRVAPGSISGPSARAERDVFGERARVKRYAPAPVVPFLDRLDVFNGPVGLFTAFDESGGRAPGAQLLASAGREEGKPVVEVYRLGKGRVVRVGAAGWGASLAAGDAGVSQVTARLIAEALE